MKRKFKLFATVASLCLSVALMAFGVYAAAQVTYTVSGNVSYTVDNTLVTVTTTAAYMVTTDGGNEGVKHGNTGTNVTTEFVTGKFYKDDTSAVTGGDAWTSYETSGENEGLLKADPDGEASVAVNFNTSTVWKITINVKTINESGVHVKAVASVAENQTNYGILAAETYNDVTVTKGADGSDPGKDFVFYIYLKDTKLNTTVAKDAYSIVLSIDQDAGELSA